MPATEIKSEDGLVAEDDDDSLIFAMSDLDSQPEVYHLREPTNPALCLFDIANANMMRSYRKFVKIKAEYDKLSPLERELLLPDVVFNHFLTDVHLTRMELLRAKSWALKNDCKAKDLVYVEFHLPGKVFANGNSF